MALGATVYTIDIDLADADRSVYESLALRVARHPSESDDYLIARALAYCLEYTEGIEFSKGGLSDPDEPPIAVRDLTGAMTAWIDIGSPHATRLARAAQPLARRAGAASRRQAVAARRRLHAQGSGAVPAQPVGGAHSPRRQPRAARPRPRPDYRPGRAGRAAQRVCPLGAPYTGV